MPSFEVLIVGAPLGFTKGCRAFNALLKSNAESSQKLLQTAVAASRNIVENSTKSELKDEYDSLLYIFTSMTNATPVINDSALIISILDMNTYLSTDAINSIVAAKEFANQSAAASAVISAATNGIENLKWKIGVSIASSSCNNLMAPFVSLSFDVKEKSGQLRSHSFELMYSEFQEFHRMFAQVASVMDNM